MNQSTGTPTTNIPTITPTITPDDLSPRRKKALIQVLGAITYGELKAYDGATASAEEAPTESDRRIYKKIAAEELRHHKGFSRRLTALGADVERAMKPYREGLDSFHAAPPGDEIHQAVAGYLGEGIAADMLGWLKKVTDSETTAFIDTVIEDEVEHEKIATEKLLELIGSSPDGRARAEAGVRRMILRMLGSGAGPGGSGYARFGAFLQLGQPLDLVTAIVGGIHRRVGALGIAPLAVVVPFHIPDPLGLLGRVPDPLGLRGETAA